MGMMHYDAVLSNTVAIISEEIRKAQKDEAYIIQNVYGKILVYIKTENESFITTAFAQYGTRGAAQAQQILDQTAAMFAGGDLSDEDKMAFLHEIQSLYFDSKKRSKKFTPKKYQKNDTQ